LFVEAHTVGAVLYKQRWLERRDGHGFQGGGILFDNKTEKTLPQSLRDRKWFVITIEVSKRGKAERGNAS